MDRPWARVTLTNYLLSHWEGSFLDLQTEKVNVPMSQSHIGKLGRSIAHLSN